MFLILLVAVIVAAIYYYIRAITFWKKQGVPQGSLKLITLEITNIFIPKLSFAELVQSIYNLVPQTR